MVRVLGPAQKSLADGAIINNSGIWHWAGDGSLIAPALNASSTFNNLAGAEFDVLSNAVFGRVNAWADCFFNNNGTLNLAGAPRTLTSDWRFRQLPASQIHLVLAGPTPANCSRIDLSSDMAFSGTLSVTFTNGYAPTNGTVFTLANYVSHIDTFTTPSLPALGNGLQWRLEYLPNALVLRAGSPAMAAALQRLPGGEFQFQFSGPNGSACIIEATEDFHAWAPVFTNAPFTGMVLYNDPSAAMQPQRFYRMRIEP